jgi:hypothetical protein
VFGLACGSIVLTWLYNGTGQSILACAVWHGLFNITTATAAASGTIAAVTSTFVIIQAFVLLGFELRARKRGETSVLSSSTRRRPTLAPGHGPEPTPRRRHPRSQRHTLDVVQMTKEDTNEHRDRSRSRHLRDSPRSAKRPERSTRGLAFRRTRSRVLAGLWLTVGRRGARRAGPSGRQDAGVRGPSGRARI